MKKKPALFLDRDGVINQRIPGAYVRHPREFEFCPGSAEAIAYFRKLFSPILVVTNQQGIGKGLMSVSDLAAIHQYMLEEVQKVGGLIDGVYYCPDLATRESNCRKPDPAMALQAQAEFPEIEFENSMMVGDSTSDMAFGHQLGMYCVLIEGKEEEQDALSMADPIIDARFPSLWAYAQTLGAG